MGLGPERGMQARNEISLFFFFFFFFFVVEKIFYSPQVVKFRAGLQELA
jgi:hypothetical protein